MTTPTYNRDGITVDTIVSSGTSQDTAAQIQRSCGITIVIASYGGGGGTALKLPSNTDIGDVVEVYRSETSSQPLSIYPSSGSETFLTTGLSDPVSLPQVSSKKFKKLTSSGWWVE